MKDPHNIAQRVICFGESFWHASGPASGPLGFPVMMAYHLKMLGADPLLVTKVGLDEQGKKMIRFVEAIQLNTDCFQIDYDYPTGVAGFPHYGRKREAWHSVTTDETCCRNKDDVSLVLHSTLPLLQATSRASLFVLKEQHPRHLIYVAPHVTALSKEAVQRSLEGAHMLYLHIRELEEMTGWFAPFAAFNDRITFLQHMFRIPYVVVSLEDGGHCINAQGITHTVHGNNPASDPAVSMIFLAGFLSQYLSGMSIEQAVRFATKLQQFISHKGDVFTPYNSDRITCFKEDR